jgi:hypothetical protein
VGVYPASRCQGKVGNGPNQALSELSNDEAAKTPRLGRCGWALDDSEPRDSELRAEGTTTKHVACHSGGVHYNGSMQTRTWPFHSILQASISVAVLMSLSARASEPTAFDLIKEGNRYVGEQAKDRIVQIRSEKSVGTLTPIIWYVVFYDPTASLKSVEVKFGAGKMLTVKRPWRLLEPVSGGDLPLDREKLKIDSPEAIKIAFKEPLLQNLKITATELKLDRVGEGVLGQGGPGQGVWKVRLWATKLRNPERDADIGEIWVSATDGQVVKNDLHINRVD